jgi:hypothetical protein
LGVLGTQETFCIVIAWLLERDSFDLFLPEFDKPWVILVIARIEHGDVDMIFLFGIF